MSTSSNIKVNIIGEFQKKGFNDAQKATTSLEKGFKRMAGALAAAFSVRAVTRFAKASLKAFQEDEKAALRLSQTVKNLGLGFADPSIKNYISSLERSANVSDDLLRPAMEKLLRTTQSVTQSQQLLNLALDISRGTGTDLVTVASDLSRAYVGQTRGLTKYNIGLTQAELKTKSFAELQAILLKQFSGQSAAYLDTYAGKVEALTIAYGNAQEVIGEGLADAFLRLAGDNGIESATNAMADFANETNDVITGITVMLEKLNSLTSWGGWKLLSPQNIPIIGSWLGIFGSIGRAEKAKQIIANPTQPVSPRNVEAATAAADKAALKRQKELIALQKKAEIEAKKRAAAAAKREREQQALRRAGTIFDMENIQIVAAMQGRIDGEQRLRLTALLALNSKNAEAAEQLTRAVVAMNAPALANLGVIIEAGDNADEIIGKLINAQAKAALVQLGIANLPKAKNPFADWDDIIAKILKDLAAIQAGLNFKMTVVTPDGKVTTTTPSVSNPTTVITSSSSNPTTYWSDPEFADNPLIDPTTSVTDSTFFEVTKSVTDLLTDYFMTSTSYTPLLEQIERDAGSYMLPAAGEENVAVSVTVNIAGNLTSEQDLIAAIQDGLYASQKTGKQVLYNSVAI